MSRWFILRTSGGRTLALAASLREAGYDVWTPARTLRRNISAKTPTGTRLIEVEVPILPTFVFARESDVDDLFAVAGRRDSPHPPFSVFRHAGRVPMMSDESVAGLREEEVREAATMQAMRDAESRDAAEAIRIAAIQSESARRRAEKELERSQRTAMRLKRARLDPGASVGVTNMAALVGVVGVIEEDRGSFARVLFGNRSWKIDGWRLIPAASHDNMALRSHAA